MQHQFKPGDLALIVGCRRRPEYLGMTIELIELISPDQISKWCDRIGRKTQNTDDEPTWLFATPEGSSELVAPRFLMPLRDDHAPQSENQKELTHG